MENQEEQNINNNFTEDNQVTLDEERDKKKKARILIAVELILLILVILLAIIFFSSRSGAGLGINIFNRETDNQVINNAPQSGGLVTNTDSNSGSNNIPVVNNPDVSVPSGSNSQVVESVRLSLPVPSQSPVSSENDIPAGAIKILGLDNGFSPNEFRVNAGEEITLALTSKIKYPVILTFYEETMPAISIGCGPLETRWVTFTAPNTPGRYTFRNDVFGKSDQTGVMIVE